MSKQRIRVIEPETDDKLLKAVRAAWDSASFHGMSFHDIAGEMIAYDDNVAACAHPMDYRGMDIPDFEGLECRIVALLPQVMRVTSRNTPLRPPVNYLRMFLTRIFPPLFAVNLIVLWYLA